MTAGNAPDLTIEQFATANIDPGQFNHEAHVYMGWLYVQEYGLAGAMARFDTAIHNLVTKFGAEDKYHATITWFFLMMIGERIEDDEPWEQFKTKNADILEDGRALLSRYYDEEILFSPRARGRFLLPNKLAR
ncbi:MAG: hypothetical protein K0U72_00835 [Gammaproteobacteria bacterium]|nr:hypothetical protein [Gammaproteobacteria bacterium]